MGVCHRFPPTGRPPGPVGDGKRGGRDHRRSPFAVFSWCRCGFFLKAFSKMVGLRKARVGGCVHNRFIRFPEHSRRFVEAQLVTQ